MIFTLTILLRNYHYTAEVVHRDRRTERWRVVRMGVPSVAFVLESNRPYIREVKKLKHHRLTWKVIERGGENQSEVERIIEKLEME